MTEPTAYECDLPSNWTTADAAPDEIAFTRSAVALTLCARRTEFEPTQADLLDQHVWTVAAEVDVDGGDLRKFVASFTRRSDAVRALLESVEQAEELLGDPCSRVTVSTVAEHLAVRDASVPDSDDREFRP